MRYSIVGTHCDSAVTIKFIECLVRKSRETNAKEYLSKGLLHLIHFMQCMTLLCINFRIVEIIIRNHHNVRYCVLLLTRLECPIEHLNLDSTLFFFRKHNKTCLQEKFDYTENIYQSAI